MKAAKDMATSQSLRTCFRSDVEGNKRMCHAGLHWGVFVIAHLGSDKNPPLVADLIPKTELMVDFDEETGNVDIKLIMGIAKLILSHNPKNCHGFFIEGKARLGALIGVICNKGHSVKTLKESDLEMMVGKGYRNLRMHSGTMETDRALIVKNSLKDNPCFQLSSDVVIYLYFMVQLFSMI